MIDQTPRRPDNRPWEPQYKIKPGETARLTAADVVGPDGIVYPDWRYAGRPGGIPNVATVVKVNDFGATADDEQDDSAALLAAVQSAAKQGGGAVELGSGTYTLARPVIVAFDNIVIRGQGPGKTKVVFTYAGSDSIEFFNVKQDQTLGIGDWVQIHFKPTGIKKLSIKAGPKSIFSATANKQWGGKFSTGFAASRLAEVMPKGGTIAVTAYAEWEDGQSAEQTVSVKFDPSRVVPEGQRRHPFRRQLGAITFAGDADSGPPVLLATDGKRGDTVVQLAEEADLKVGDAVAIEAPATPGWNELVKNASTKWGTFRRYEFSVTAVQGKSVTLNQPLRIDYPAGDKAFLQKIYPIRNCGVEGFTISQPNKLWTSGVLFTNAWSCWARDMQTRKTGRHPIYFDHAKNCEVRDCDFEEAWYLADGGTAYVGWETAYDCLMENVSARKLRHGPLVQWAASGNVVRNSTFEGMDAQWHAGWTNENLFENCVVRAPGDHGSYGCGAWGSPPQDPNHGPEGPRNVVYNCDFVASRDGIYMGGMNEAWILVYNRIRLQGDKPGICVQPWSFDHVIRGNTFIFEKPTKNPAILLMSENCVGIEVSQNITYGGNGQIVGGKAKPDVAENNQAKPQTSDAPRPTPAVPSIFQWQRERAAQSAPSVRH